jgi:hypothetical protein
MNKRKKFVSRIQGHLDILCSQEEEELDGEIKRWDEVYIHGDPEGLRSFAKLLLELADLNQEAIYDKILPIGAKEHVHLRPNLELSKSSATAIVGRLDAKGSGEFYNRYIPKDEIK